GFMSQSGMVSIQGDFQMSPDMVQEVKVLTSAYAPEYGSSSSGQITMVSKSGGNQYHGAAFEYARNKVFNAAPWNSSCSGTGCDRRPSDNEHDLAQTSVARSRYRSFTTGPPSIIRSSI